MISGENLREELAFQLTRCALSLDHTRSDGAPLSPDLAASLNENLELWVKIRTFAMHKDCPWEQRTRNNLVDLSKFVADRTFAAPDGLAPGTLDVLININLQISEGLLEGEASGGTKFR